MKYLALIYTAAGVGPAPGTPEFGQMMGAYMAVTEGFKKDNVFLGGNALQPVSTATAVRVRGGKVETIDGPFAETKEQLGGYYLFECANLDDAIKYAAMIPSAKFGTIEVRPVVEYPA